MEYFADNLRFLRKQQGKTQAVLSNQLGFKRAAWNHYENKVSKPGIEDLIAIAKFFQVTETDLLHVNIALWNMSVNEKKVMYGRSPAVITINKNGEQNIAVVAGRTRRDYEKKYNDSEYIQSLPSYQFPGYTDGAYRVFEVEGEAMMDILFPGDLVIAEYVSELTVIEDDLIYVLLVEHKGLLIKTVVNEVAKKGRLILRAENKRDKQHISMSISLNQVKEAWCVRGFISKQLRRESNLYEMVQQIEQRLRKVETRKQSTISKRQPATSPA